MVTLADLTGNGILDIVTSNDHDNTVTVLLGRGDGTFGDRHDYPVGKTPVALAVANVNGDGHMDIVTANRDGNSISLAFPGLGRIMAPAVETPSELLVRSRRMTR